MFFILSMLIPKGNNVEKVHNTWLRFHIHFSFLNYE
jgi:hypothetical protein